MLGIIGGSGFIGTRLAQRLTESNTSFKILDTIQSISFPKEWEYCDVTDSISLKNGLKGISIIINLAAEHKDNVSPVSLYYDVNVQGAKNICEAAQYHNIKHIIFTSSVAVYGFVEKETDEDGVYNPFNHYGISKLEAEKVFNNWYKNHSDGSLFILRPTVVFGEKNRGNVYNLFRQIASGKFLMIGAGNNKKSMAYVENIAAFIQHIASVSSGIHVVNYIDKPDFSMNELTNIICTSLGKKTNNIRIPFFVGLMGGYAFDLLSKISGKEFPVSSIRIKKFCARTQFTSKHIADYNFVKPVPLEGGISRTVRDEFLLKNNHDAS